METTQRTLETDLDLIRACRKGDAQAWGRLLDKYEVLVYSIPLNYGLSHHDAADIAQLTFTSLIQSLDTLAEDSRLGAWLATVARRNTWRTIERARRESVGDYEVLAERLPSLGKPNADQLERWELTDWLNNGLLQLNERCRTLLLALYLEPQEPSYADVATRIGVPVGSIGPTRARCLERLKRALEEQ